MLATRRTAEHHTTIYSIIPPQSVSVAKPVKGTHL